MIKDIPNPWKVKKVWPPPYEEISIGDKVKIVKLTESDGYEVSSDFRATIGKVGKVKKIDDTFTSLGRLLLIKLDDDSYLFQLKDVELVEKGGKNK